MSIYLILAETVETPATPVQPVFEHRFPGPREPHPVRFPGPPMEGQHPARFPAGSLEGQQAWIQQQQQQRFSMEPVGPRMLVPSPGGEHRFPGPPGPFPTAVPTPAGPQPVPAGERICAILYSIVG